MSYDLITSAATKESSDSRLKDQSTIVADGGVSGERYASGLETLGTRSTGTSITRDRPSTAGVRKTKVVASNVIHACKGLFAACEENLDRAIDNNAEFFLRNTAIEQVKDALGLLWVRRTDREEQFAEIINALQGVFANRNVEDFSVDQLACIRAVFEKLALESQFDDEFSVAVVTDLLNGEVDVFRELD